MTLNNQFNSTQLKQYNVVEELLLQAENIMETAHIALDAEAQVSLRNSISAMRTVISAATQDNSSSTRYFAKRQSSGI